MPRRLPALLLLLLALLPSQALAAGPQRTTVLFVGGYGSSLAGATRSFAPLRSALAARDPGIAFAQFSYSGWDAGACAPQNYSALDTGQKLETTEQRLLETVYALHAQCGAGRVIVI